MSTNPQKVYLLRHGETAWSLSGQHTGRTDLPLLPEGEAQAKKLAPFLANVSFAHVWSSPLKRALDTCRLSGLGDQVSVMEALTEWNYGRYEGVKTVDIHQENPHWNLFLEGAPEGETPVDVARRLDQLILKIREIKGNIALYAHGHILRALAARWIGQSIAVGSCLGLNAGSLSILGWEHEADPIIKLWNFIP